MRPGLVLPSTVAIIVVLLCLFRNPAEVAIILATLPPALVAGVRLLYLLEPCFGPHADSSRLQATEVAA